MGSRLVWVVVLLAIAGAWFLFGGGDATDGPAPIDVGGAPEDGEPRPSAPELMGSGGTHPIVPTAIRGRGMLQGAVRIAGAGVEAEVELRHVTEIDPKSPFQGGYEQMFIERLLDSGISRKEAIGRTNAGADGRFQFKGLAPGLYEVRATVASGAMGFASGMLPAHGARVEVNVDINAGDQTLQGRVLYANDKPFRGMVVATAGEQAFVAAMMGGVGQVRPTTTDENGHFELRGLPQGRYQISAIIPGELRVMGAPIDLPYEGEYELKILVGGTTVQGKVISAASEQPIAGANVFGGGGNPETNFSIFSTQSGADGTFTLTIPAGRGGGMFVRAAGYAPQMVEFRGGADENVVVSMLALGRLSGRVTRQEGGTPQQGVTVFAAGQQRGGMTFGANLQAAVTDADGRYALDGVQPGAVKVHALGGGWSSVGLGGFGFGDIKTPYVVEIEPGGSAEKDLEVIASGRVTGRVLAPDGRPVPGAVVQAGGPGDVRAMVAAMMGMGISFASDVTDNDGVYTIDAIVPGTEYSMGARAPEHPDASSRSFTGTSGKQETIDITFPKARWLEVRVVQADGKPVAGAAVTVAPKREGGMRTALDGFFGTGNLWATDREGKVRAGPLPEGELEVGARAAGYIESSQDIAADQEGNVTLELRKGLVIAGRIVLPEGVPAQSIRVNIQREHAQNQEWFYERAGVDAAGRFRVDTLKSPGEYKISGRGSWENRAFTGSVVADAGDEDVVLELTENLEEKRETVEVQVIDADGKPVPSGRITLWSFRGSGNSTSTSSTRINNGKAVLRGFETDGEVYVEVYDLVGSARGATIQGPVVFSAGKLEVRLPRPLVIAGLVSGPDGKGVAGVRINAHPIHPRGDSSRMGREHGDAVTDGDGRFEIKGLGPLEYTLGVRAPQDYAPVPSFKAQGGDAKVSIALRAGAGCALTFLDHAGKPVAGVTVHLDHSREAAPDVGFLEEPTFGDAQPASDAQGVLRIKGLEPGVAFTLTIQPPGHRLDDLRTIKQTGWTPADETFTFVRAYAIEGHVRTTEGKVPTNVNVRWRKAGTDNWNWGGNVQEDGSFEITQLEAGRYELKVAGGVSSVARPRRPGEAPPPEPNVVAARAGATGVKLVVDLGASLTVVLRGMERGEAHMPATAYLREDREGGGAFLHGQWERQDTLAFRGLRPDATYTLWIGGLPGGKYVSRPGVRAQAATLTVEPVQGGTITGVVKIPPEAGTLRHVSVSAYSLAGHGANGTVDLKTGRFSIDGLPEGAWTITAGGWGEDSGQWQGRAAAAALGAHVEITLAKQDDGR